MKIAEKIVMGQIAPERASFGPANFFRGKRRGVLAFALLFSALSWTLPDAALEARANGNVSADEPAPAPQLKKTVRKAPIRRAKSKPGSKKAPRKPAAAKVKKTPLKPKPPAPTSLERGIALMDEGRYKQAYPWLQKAVQEERRNPNAWYWYGLYHDTVGQYQQAQFFYVKALEQDPSFPLLSRVVTYPDDGGRKALWDPLRPARLYPVEAGYPDDIRAVPQGSPEAALLPARPPVDPEAPKVPIYIPPEPLLGGGETPSPVYVPPSAPPGPQALKQTTGEE